ncbi:MAG: alpha-L-arabinofuranosidase C-terminal domain-containing protein [Kiritimatiellia bacterium]
MKMKNGLLMLSAALVFAASAESGNAAAGTVELTIGEKGFDVPKSLWGIFFEDINWAADGGLNPEMLANGGFDWLQADHQNNPRDDRAWNSVEDGWEADFREGGMARLSFQYGAPVHPNTAKHLRIETFGTGRAGVRNRGLDGMWIKSGEPYRLSYDWREIRLAGIDYELGAWKRETVEFTAGGESPAVALATNDRFDIILEPDRDRVTLSILVKGRRAVEFDNVSLQPTGPNLVRAGLRRDLVDHLANLKPAFVRFPGGCIVEEGDFQHWYDWRRTVGPKERRECIQNRWARPGKPYWETFGVGYYEYFRLCEEIGAEPLPICLSGLTCQYQKPPLMCAVEDVDYFADVILELIEFANGAVTTKWGRVRAEMGHPAPFNLKMVGIGNENWNAEFFDRCEPIAKILRAKHPEIKIIGSAGPAPDEGRFKYAWNRVTKESADVVDEHFYCDPNWFLAQAHRYDGYDRTTKPKVYAGEYACHHRVGNRKQNTFWSALCEAAAMTGFERNSDVVEMTSYAPLFAREGHDQWSPDLIWFNGTESWLTPNYYVQQLFSIHRPDVELPVTLSTEKDFYACAGAKGGRTIIKLVNTADHPRMVRMNRAGMARVITLTAADRNAINVRGNETVRPVETACELKGGITVPANSLTVVEL